MGPQSSFGRINGLQRIRISESNPISQLGVPSLQSQMLLIQPQNPGMWGCCRVCFPTLMFVMFVPLLSLLAILKMLSSGTMTLRAFTKSNLGTKRRKCFNTRNLRPARPLLSKFRIRSGKCFGAFRSLRNSNIFGGAAAIILWPRNKIYSVVKALGRMCARFALLSLNLSSI